MDGIALFTHLLQLSITMPLKVHLQEAVVVTGTLFVVNCSGGRHHFISLFFGSVCEIQSGVGSSWPGICWASAIAVYNFDDRTGYFLVLRNWLLPFQTVFLLFLLWLYLTRWREPVAGTTAEGLPGAVSTSHVVPPGIPPIAERVPMASFSGRLQLETSRTGGHMEGAMTTGLTPEGVANLRTINDMELVVL